jgi:predicted unusual protein kinase regulating ubiquinone biosynthesis (AarF/ABC1/UbiB family)
VIAEATDSDFMVQEFVPGTSFEKFAKVEPVLARVAAEEAAKLWLENALLTNGFFHSDLHQGNMRVQRVGNDVAVTLLDYGMTSQMTPKAQNQFLAFGLAMKSADAKLISRVLWELSIPEKNKITREQLEHTLAIEIVKRHGAEDLPFYEWPGIAMNAGIAFPSDFTAINRGFVLLIRMLEDMGSTMNLTGVMKTLVSKNPQKALAALNSVKAISKLDWAKFGFDKLTGTRVFNPPPHATLRCEALF